MQTLNAMNVKVPDGSIIILLRAIRYTKRRDMEPYIYFHIIYLLLFLNFGEPNLEEVESEDHPDILDHLTRPDEDYNEGYEEVTFSYNDHNDNNDHVTFASTDQPDPEQETSADKDILQLEDQLTTENELFDENESYNERPTSRMLAVLSRGLLRMERKPEPDFEYEIEDRIVRYALNNHNLREEI